METATLSDLCYEHIVDNFWYGSYGGFRIIIDRSQNFFNATKLCQDSGKDINQWLRLKGTHDRIEYYARQTQSPPASLSYTLVGSRNPLYNITISGTYVIEALIVNLATWISIHFEDKVRRITMLHFSRHIQDAHQRRMEEEELERELERERERERERARMRAEAEAIRARAEHLQTQNTELTCITQTYRNVEEDISPKIQTSSKRNTLSLIDKGETSETHPLCAIRIQTGSKHLTLKRLRRDFPNLRILQNIPYNPNAINLFNLAKENIANIQCWYNHIRLINGYTVEQLMADLERLSKTKFHTSAHN